MGPTLHRILAFALIAVIFTSCSRRVPETPQQTDPAALTIEQVERTAEQTASASNDSGAGSLAAHAVTPQSLARESADSAIATQTEPTSEASLARSDSPDRTEVEDSKHSRRDESKRSDAIAQAPHTHGDRTAAERNREREPDEDDPDALDLSIKVSPISLGAKEHRTKNARTAKQDGVLSNNKVVPIPDPLTLDATVATDDSEGRDRDDPEAPVLDSVAKNANPKKGVVLNNGRSANAKPSTKRPVAASTSKKSTTKGKRPRLNDGRPADALPTSIPGLERDSGDVLPRFEDVVLADGRPKPKSSTSAAVDGVKNANSASAGSANPGAVTNRPVSKSDRNESADAKQRSGKGDSKQPNAKKVLSLPAQFRALDKNKDGQIGLYEWPREKFAEFGGFDKNKDGFLTPRELSVKADSKSKKSKP